MSASGITQRGGFQRIQSCAATIASLAGEGCVTPKRNLLPTEGLAPPAHLASVNNAVVDFCVQVFVWLCFQFSWACTRPGVSGSYHKLYV